MDRNKESEIILALRKPLEYAKEVKQLASDEPELLNGIYREISEKLGASAALELYRTFRGQQISFPLRLLDPEKVHMAIVQEYDGTNIRELTVKYGYSEKTVRRIIKEHLNNGKRGNEK